MTYKGQTQLTTNMAKGQNHKRKIRDSKSDRAYLDKQIDIQSFKIDHSIRKIGHTIAIGRIICLSLIPKYSKLTKSGILRLVVEVDKGRE